jgi:hypothetical protein
VLLQALDPEQLGADRFIHPRRSDNGVSGAQLEARTFRLTGSPAGQPFGFVRWHRALRRHHRDGSDPDPDQEPADEVVIQRLRRRVRQLRLIGVIAIAD